MRTPIELREQAVALSKTYLVGHITKALNLSGTEFKKWSQQSETTVLSTFVSLPKSVANMSLSSNVEAPFANCERLCLHDGDSALLHRLVQALRA
ncbi:MAG: hypothetical protein ABJD02_00955 [Paraglaciecola sp.]|uniref:hypothetical protein n=1 Tax=Paraglaciecola sp. TaxID=1920173 RepID=UPI003262F78E